MFTMIIAAMAFILLLTYFQRKYMYKTIAGFVNSGKTVPEELIKNFDIKTQSRAKGIKLISIGIALIIVLAVLHPNRYFFIWGLLPIFSGIGNLIVYVLENKK